MVILYVKMNVGVQHGPLQYVWVCLRLFCVSMQPLMREVVENKVEITKDEARALIERCLKVLYYRDARSYNRVSR